MKVSNYITCKGFPCTDIITDRYTIPTIEINPSAITILMISEAPSPDPNDYFYAPGNPFYLETTSHAFKQAGSSISSLNDILERGIFITTAVKCGKITYSLSAKTIKNCSELLEEEINLFPQLKVLLLMGDVAIKALNYIAKRQTGEKVIPSGSIYKIRKNEYFYKGMRVFPSYLQTGKSFLIEKSKQKMIAEDIQTALKIG
jgi:uracil-DNA glycosylase